MLVLLAFVRKIVKKIILRWRVMYRRTHREQYFGHTLNSAIYSFSSAINIVSAKHSFLAVMKVNPKYSLKHFFIYNAVVLFHLRMINHLET